MSDEPIRQREDVEIENKASSLPEGELARMTDDIVAALKTVYDPEIPADIYELGLIYKVDISDDRKVAIDMTLTAPGCPVAGEMPGWVENAVAAVPGVQSCAVTMVFDPPWGRHMMSEAAKLETGIDDPAERLRAIADRRGMLAIFKGSWDKANRSAGTCDSAASSGRGAPHLTSPCKVSSAATSGTWASLGAGPRLSSERVR